MAQECVGARHVICIVTHVCDLIVCSLSLFLILSPSAVFLLSLLLLLPGLRRGNIPLAPRQMRSLVLWPKTPLSQVMSPIF